MLRSAEKNQLRALAEEVSVRAEPALSPQGQPLPWDIEFGFLDGELTLFQIRPLVERGQARADRILVSLLPSKIDRAISVDLTAAPSRTR